MSESDIDNAISTISGYVSACMAGIDEGASDYDKAVHFYEYVIEHAEYEENSPHNQDMYSAVLGRTVCQGYAMMFKYLCDGRYQLAYCDRHHIRCKPCLEYGISGWCVVCGGLYLR